MQYLEVPGTKTFELPPLLVQSVVGDEADDSNLTKAVFVEAEDMLAATDADPEMLEQRKFDLALNLVNHYCDLKTHWCWGHSVLEWIRQCELTFEYEDALRFLLHPDVWPHAGRANFVRLLSDKGVPPRSVALEKAVGLRLTFRQPPPIDCFSNQFLFYLNGTVADTAYRTWSQMSPQSAALFPPERFHFEVLTLRDPQ